MSSKRLVALSICIAGLMLGVLGRVYLTATNKSYAQRADAQVVTNLRLEQRGNLYDRNGLQLTGAIPCYYALCIPGESSYANLFDQVPYTTQTLLYDRRNSVLPFFVPVEEDLTAQGVTTCQSSRYFCPLPIAEHLIGTLDAEGQGASGLEKAYNDLLSRSSATDVVQCVTTAEGELIQPIQTTRVAGDARGLQLTLDAGIQRVCEALADRDMTSGCILLLDCKTAQVLASVSRPGFDPDNLGKSIRAGDTSLVNRAFSAFSVGSVFKPVLAAAALEQGLNWYTHNCQGAVEVSGQVYHCAKSIAHGRVNMRQALEQSCNCYFIELGLALGGEKILAMAQTLGLGQALAVGGGLYTASGQLPEAEALSSRGQLANFSFGQGAFTATPVQLAAVINTIVNDGMYTAPSFVLGTLDTQTMKYDREIVPEQHRAFSRTTARQLQKMLASVVEEGIGRDAQTEKAPSAGKTGTAQTGRYDRTGSERMDYWFAGFYPAAKPQYTIVVLQDSQVSPPVSCATIFSRVCNALELLKNS